MFVAGFVRGLTGVGLAVVLVPLVNLILPPERTVLLAVLIGCLAGLMGYRAPRAPLPPQGKAPAILTGLLTGFLGAFAAIPGPPVIYYFERKGVPAATTRDAMIVNFFWAPLAVAIIALALGKLDWPLATHALACFPTLAG